MKRLLPLLCALLLTGGCHDSRFEEPAADGSAPPATATIAQLRAAYLGSPFAVESDITVTGIVTTSDRRGNFYRSFCIEQQGAGLEIMAGLDHLYRDYPAGSRITLHLKGLTLGESRGVLQVGRTPAPGSGYPTDYLGSKPALDRAVIRSGLDAAPEPVRRTIDELTPARCGTLVRIDAVRYAIDEIVPATWAGERLFTDEAGHEIRTFVRSYADFADKEIPTGTLSLCGILQRNGTHYLIKPRDENDISTPDLP